MINSKYNLQISKQEELLIVSRSTIDYKPTYILIIKNTRYTATDLEI